MSTEPSVKLVIMSLSPSNGEWGDNPPYLTRRLAWSLLIPGTKVCELRSLVGLPL